MTAVSDRRWWWLIAAAAVCTILYLAGSLGGAEVAVVGRDLRARGATHHISIPAAVVAALILALLSFCTIALSARFARRAGGGVSRLVGVGRSHRVPLAVLVHLGVLFIAVPLLTALGRAIGARGTTTPGLDHRSEGYILLISCLAVLVAPWMEETAMRGFLLEGLWRRHGFWPAAVASALVWSALHGVSGVLLPFVALGVSFCWVRRETGNTRTGIALHGAQNTFASLIAGAGVAVIAPVVVLVASLWVTRTGNRDRVTETAHDAVLVLRRAARSVAAAGARLPTPADAVWSVAGAVALGVTLIETRPVLADEFNSEWVTAGHLIFGLAVAPLLGWLLLTSPRGWGASRATAAAGGSGAAIILVGRVADLPTIVPIGFVLVSYGLFGIALALGGGRARAAAGAAGFCLALALAPIPYLVTGARGFAAQELAVLIVAALALIVLGFALRRERATPL